MRCHHFTNAATRRDLLKASGCGFGSLALAAMAGREAAAATATAPTITGPLAPKPPHFPPRAKRVIFLFMWGGPSHVDLFDPKPRLATDAGKQLTGKDVGLPEAEKQLGSIMASPFAFSQHGESGIWISELFPQLAARHADRLCVVRSLHTEGTAHGEALLKLHTGQSNLVRPSVGAWVSYGLGSDNADLPAYIVLTSFGSGRPNDQPLYDRLWGAGFLPNQHQGVRFRNTGDPVLYLADPPGVNRDLRRATLDRIASLNASRGVAIGDPDIAARTAQYEMAFCMQLIQNQV